MIPERPAKLGRCSVLVIPAELLKTVQLGEAEGPPPPVPAKLVAAPPAMKSGFDRTLAVAGLATSTAAAKAPKATLGGIFMVMLSFVRWP
jgi:hypothetical protein